MDPWEKISEREVYRGSFRKVDEWRYRMPNGKEKGFEITRSGEVVVAVALTPDMRFILTRQFRPGPGKVLDEIPAGYKESDETPEEAARRELLEETGFSGDFTFIGIRFQGAYSDMRRHVFLVQNCVKVQEPSPDENEFIEVVFKSLGAFRRHLRGGMLTDGDAGYLVLDHLKL